MFEAEVSFLRKNLPGDIVRRYEHFGSTAVPNLAAKPIIDILVEVSSLEVTRQIVVPILEKEGYEYFWRPSQGEDPPFYAWFIKRNRKGDRTHHIHMVEAESELWDRLYFRDYLRRFPDKAQEYEHLKADLSVRYSHDRVAYSKGKSEFITAMTTEAKELFRSHR
jgi:GrpB-like predicted nucleotidyltransferase (UPF0157 family)